MNLTQLAYLCQLLERHKIPASQLIVKGKRSKRISFTAPRRYAERILKLAQDNNLAFDTSTDIFISKSKTRFHLTFRRLPT